MEEIIYTWLLVHKNGGVWTHARSKAIEKPICGEPDKLEWIKWDKPLLEDIDTFQYKYNAETSELESI